MTSYLPWDKLPTHQNTPADVFGFSVSEVIHSAYAAIQEQKENRSPYQLVDPAQNRVFYCPRCQMRTLHRARCVGNANYDDPHNLDPSVVKWQGYYRCTQRECNAAKITLIPKEQIAFWSDAAKDLLAEFPNKRVLFFTQLPPKADRWHDKYYPEIQAFYAQQGI